MKVLFKHVYCFPSVVDLQVRDVALDDQVRSASLPIMKVLETMPNARLVVKTEVTRKRRWSDGWETAEGKLRPGSLSS